MKSILYDISTETSVELIFLVNLSSEYKLHHKLAIDLYFCMYS